MKGMAAYEQLGIEQAPKVIAFETVKPCSSRGGTGL
jgi:hypothetical protein